MALLCFLKTLVINLLITIFNFLKIQSGRRAIPGINVFEILDGVHKSLKHLIPSGKQSNF